MKKLVAATAALVVFVASGGVWIGVVRLLPAGAPRSVAVVVFALVFAGVFVWLLVSRVRRILAGDGRLLRHGAVAALELALLLAVFASVYQKLGIMDNSGPQSGVSHAYLDSLYYSVVTFTTLGYGDFYPRGVGRVLAGIQALTGYVILGVLASTLASVISPHNPAGGDKARQEED